MNSTSTQPASSPAVPLPERGNIGTVVVGGNYQRLAIVRSLGRHGVPVCVVGNEHSISRFLQYCTQFVKLSDLRDELSIFDNLLTLKTRLDLHRWVLFFSREKLVAAFSRNRSRLTRIFRVPTTDWDSVKSAWNERNTSRFTQELSISMRITKNLMHIDELAELDGLMPPFMIKAAIKKHFIYATKAKAWHANDHAELKLCFM